MLQFIKDSFREIRHVVWPTRKESKTYFLIVVGILIAFGVYVFLASTLFTNIVIYLKDFIN